MTSEPGVIDDGRHGFCETCGVPREGVKFCPECGDLVNDDSTCDDCGHAAHDPMNGCDECACPEADELDRAEEALRARPNLSTED